MKKFTMLLMLSSILLLSCNKEISVTEEANQLSDDYFSSEKIETTWNGIDPKVETIFKPGMQKYEFSASPELKNELITKITERQFKSPVNIKAYGYSAAVLKSGPCNGPILKIIHDTEDNNNKTEIHVWAGDTYLDGNRNLIWLFCACDVNLFTNLQNLNYAVLRIGWEEPSNAVAYQIERRFDAEDDNNKTRAYWDEMFISDPNQLSPTIIQGNPRMFFYYFPSVYPGPYYLSTSIGSNFGIFARVWRQNQWIYTDDEDRNNLNEWSIKHLNQSPIGYDAFDYSDIMFGSDNTKLWTMQVVNGEPYWGK